MKCKDVNRMLYSFLDGELNEDMHRKVQQHVSTCTKCIETISHLREINSVIEAEKASVELNTFFAQKVVDRLQSKSNQASAPIIPLRRITVVSIAAAGIFLGVLIGSMANAYLISKPSDGFDYQWSQLADDYFPNEPYSPYDELSDNN
jgi:anti-sigma factor RsiW